MFDPANEIAAKVATNIITEAFKSCFKSLADAEDWITRQNRARDFFGTAAAKYARKVETRYNSMRIFGMTSPVPLRDIYTRVNILDKITSSHRETVQDLEQFFDRDRRSFGRTRSTEGGVNVVNRIQRLIVLGKPGAGKTTFLKYIALQALDGKLEFKTPSKKRGVKRIPIFVSLKDWSDSSDSLLDFIARQFDICDFPEADSFIERVLVSGKCLLLLDGFDEVNKRVEDAITQIRSFVDKYNANQFVLSCRIAAYSYCFEQFTDVEIADFTPEQIKAFVENWFGNENVKANLCWERIKNDKSIRELASVPLLLTMLCLAFDETMEFPLNRSELYKEALDALLKKWDASRSIKRDEIYRHLSNRRKESMFSRIAAATFEAGQYFLHQRVLEKHIAEFIQNLPEAKEANLDVDCEAILKSIEAQHGIFSERAKRIYSFSHLTFQEYFTAKYIVDSASRQSLERLIESHADSEKWREVFLITTGMLEEADDFLLQLKKKADSLITNDTIILFVNAVQSCIVEEQLVYSLLPNWGLNITYDRARLLSLALLFAREYILALDRTGQLPVLFPSAKARAGNSDLSVSLGLLHELANDLGGNSDSNLDAMLLGLRNDIAPLSRLPRGTYDQDITYLRSLNRTGNDHPLIHSAFELALKPDLSQLVRYITVNGLILKCLNTECYVLRNTRENMLDQLLMIGANKRGSSYLNEPGK